MHNSLIPDRAERANVLPHIMHELTPHEERSYYASPCKRSHIVVNHSAPKANT